MDLLEMLKGAVNDQFIGQLSEKIGAEPEQTATGLESAFAAILGGLSKNVAQPEGANALLSVLDRDHNGSIFDDLAGFVLGGKQAENPSMTNGVGILKHVLGGNAGSVVDAISKNSGMDTSKVMQLLVSAAPMVLGMLGKAKQQQVQQAPQSNAGGNILDMILNSNKKVVEQNTNHSIFEKLLDQDGDGSIMDDLLQMGGKSLLGGLFKK